MREFIIVETRPSNGFVVYHIEYTSELLSKYPEYSFFSDMLRTNLRMKTVLFLRTMESKGWRIDSQSQDTTSIYYTMSRQCDAI